jgi:GNAT superfamily N-acetyltransferase
MVRQVTYETFAYDEVTEPMIRDAAKLFNENYGIWDASSKRAGEHIKLSAGKLREQYLFGASSSYTRVTVDGSLAGHALACRWDDKEHGVCWITQLVVHKEYRGRGLATGLIRELRAPSDDIYGIMSSHPYACMAAAKSFGCEFSFPD